MKGILLKDLYIAKSNILVTVVSLVVLGFDITTGSLYLYDSIGMSATLLAGGISLPCAYLFDSEKSQLVFMISFMASTGMITALIYFLLICSFP